MSRALALADALGMRPLTAHCHLGVGRPYCHAARSDQARTELTLAADLYRALDMLFYLAYADRMHTGEAV